ncbi:MAG: ABC transporter substrate-binding protein [Thermacetogeniaceae bacterium]
MKGGTDKTRNWIISALVLLTILALSAMAGCGKTQNQQSNQAVSKIRVFYNPTWTGTFDLLLVADAKGFFKDEGLDVEWVNLSNDQYTAALDSGKIDFAPGAGYTYFINAYNKGLNAKEVVVTSLPLNPGRGLIGEGTGLFVLKKSGIKEAKDLVGKKIATTTISFQGSWFLGYWLHQHGVSLDQVNLVEIPLAQQIQVLRSGAVDALLTSGPVALNLLASDDSVRLFDQADLAGNRFITNLGTMVNGNFLKQHPEVVRKYVTAIAKAADWANGHQAEVIQIDINKGYITPDQVTGLYGPDLSKVRWAEHGLQVEDDIKFWLGLDEDQGLVPKGKIKVTDLYTNEFNPYYKP